MKHEDNVIRKDRVITMEKKVKAIQEAMAVGTCLVSTVILFAKVFDWMLYV